MAAQGWVQEYDLAAALAIEIQGECNERDRLNKSGQNSARVQSSIRKKGTRHGIVRVCILLRWGLPVRIRCAPGSLFVGTVGDGGEWGVWGVCFDVCSGSIAKRHFSSQQDAL
jgi:hypothetical protein